jgi:HD-GYP domain-containing protein (c-di-GMP phosphodiesterase class II)
MNCPKDIDLRWAALLHDSGKVFCRVDKVMLEKEREKIIKTNYPKHEIVGAELVKMIGTNLKWSTERIEKVSNLVLHHLEDDCILRQYDNMAK